MRYSYLFDNNLYRQLTTSPNGLALKNFNNAIDKYEITKKIASRPIAFRMTPFTIMEALGITAPNPPISIPRHLNSGKKLRELLDYVISEAKSFYYSSPNLKKQYFLDKAQEQMKFTSFEATAFEKICILDPLNDDNFEDYIVLCLAFDFLYKFEFPKEIQLQALHTYFIPTFFINDSFVAGLSKFRIAKKLWDIAYPSLLKKSDYSNETIEKMNGSMRLKKLKDYLDCELVHMLSVGDYTKNTYQPVVAFTCDDGQNVINRIMTYKSIIELFINLLDDVVYGEFKSTIQSWQQGVLVICNMDGTFKDVIEVNKIVPFR